jgi:peptide/nickel transport system permease protein
MTQYVMRRLLMLVPVLVGVAFLVFAIAQLTPGDPIALMLGPTATPETVERLREQLGLNDPLLVQFVRYVWNAAHGDLGTALRGNRPVLDEILLRFPSTLQLTAVAMVFAIVVGLSSGVIAATSRQQVIRAATTVTTLLGLSIPSFWLAILLVIAFGVNLRWVAVTGGTGVRSLILPAFALGLHPAAVISRLTRSSVLEVFREDYVWTARAKGLRERLVIYRHVLRNSLLPVVTIMGLQFAHMLGGAFIIEAVFVRPGLGLFAIGAISARDYPQIQGIVLFVAAIYALVNLAVDLLYAVLDPRIQLD